MSDHAIHELVSMVDADPERYAGMNRSELLAAAHAQGVSVTEEEYRAGLKNLTDPELAGVVGGQAEQPRRPGEMRCPHCGSTNVKKSKALDIITTILTGPLPCPVPSPNCICKHCGYVFIL